MDEKKDNEDLTIDFTKIKQSLTKLFTSTPETQSLKPGNQNEFIQAKNFILTHKTACLLAILLILQFMPNYALFPWGGLHTRLQLQNLPSADKTAEDIIYKNIFQKVYTTIHQQQPNLPPQNKQALAQKEIQRIYTTDPRIPAEIQRLSTAIKTEFQYHHNGKKYTFPYDIDSYHYFRAAENILKHGNVGDYLNQNIPWDAYARAPHGTNATTELHPYVLARLYQITSIINPQTTLLQSSAYLPILMTLLTIITVFFIGRTLSGNLNGFITGTLVALNYAAITKTSWGFADTDAYNLLLPALFLSVFIHALTKPHKSTKLIIAASAILGVYAFAWSGWWYLFYLSIATSITYSIYLFKSGRKETTTHSIQTILYRTFIFFILTSIIITPILAYRAEYTTDIPALTRSATSLINQYLGPFSFSKINTATRTDLWPNVYTSVAELQSKPLPYIIKLLGGNLLIFASIIGTILLLRTPFTSTTLPYGIFLALWLIAGMYATLKGVRFTLLLVIPTSISAGYTLTYLYHKLQNSTRHTTPLKTIALIILLFVLTAFINSTNLSLTERWISQTTPFMNNAFWQPLQAIQTNSTHDALITSWWDFGHLYKYGADRGVTFDGASQNTPMAYWVGRILTTGNETEAIGILRMLDCGSNNAYEQLYEQTNNALTTIKIINTIITLPKKDAQQYLENKEITHIETILNNTHCTPPEAYFITSEDMREKSPVWSYFGNWNFERAYLTSITKNKPYEEAINDMMTTLNYTAQQAEATHQTLQTLSTHADTGRWIAPLYTYQNVVSCTRETNDDITCNNLKIQNQTYLTEVHTPEGVQTPHSITYLDTTTRNIVTQQFKTEENMNSIILFPDIAGNYYAISASPELSTSMFTRLHYFEDHNLRYFKPFIKRKQINGGFTMVWKIDWEGKTPNAHPLTPTKKTNTSS